MLASANAGGVYAAFYLLTGQQILRRCPRQELNLWSVLIFFNTSAMPLGISARMPQGPGFQSDRTQQAKQAPSEKKRRRRATHRDLAQPRLEAKYPRYLRPSQKIGGERFVGAARHLWCSSEGSRIANISDPMLAICRQLEDSGFISCSKIGCGAESQVRRIP